MAEEQKLKGWIKFAEGELMLGDTLVGRLAFAENVCSQKGWPRKETLDAIAAEALKLAVTPKRQAELRTRTLENKLLSTTALPEWMDKVWLEATCRVLSKGGGSMETRSSNEGSIAFEAGRFSAHRQGGTFFKGVSMGKTPERWLQSTFFTTYRYCYGEEAAGRIKVETMGQAWCRISMNHRNLEKATPLDCSTIIGYLYGFMELLGVQRIVISHDACCADRKRNDPLCIFDLRWAMECDGRARTTL